MKTKLFQALLALAIIYPYTHEANAISPLANKTYELVEDLGKGKSKVIGLFFNKNNTFTRMEFMRRPGEAKLFMTFDYGRFRHEKGKLILEYPKNKCHDQFSHRLDFEINKPGNELVINEESRLLSFKQVNGIDFEEYETPRADPLCGALNY